MKRKRTKKSLYHGLLLALLLGILYALFGEFFKVQPGEDPATFSSQEKGLMTVFFLDVGQGDSELIHLPDGQTMLIDAGNPENGPQIVDALRLLGIKRIDTLIATHPHADHIGGMAQVVRSVSVGSVYMPKVSTNTKTFEELLDTIRGKNLGIHTAKAGVKLYDGEGVSATMLAPVGSHYDDLNQYSAVVRLVYGKTSFLFTGDAGEESEKQIQGNIRSNVLKVGHHGSSTSTSKEFLRRVSPAYAVIEVGKGNTYGHPAKPTLTKLKEIGARIYRTDEEGTVKMVSNGTQISVETHVDFSSGPASSWEKAA